MSDTLSSPETLVRELFTALGEHDVAVTQILLAPTVVFHVLGRHFTAGDYRGFEGVVTLWDNFTYQSAGSFRLELEEVLASDRCAAVVSVCTVKQSRQLLTTQIVWLFRLSGGRIVEGWLHTPERVE